jgi:hypothetical protein
VTDTPGGDLKSRYAVRPRLAEAEAFQQMENPFSNEENEPGTALEAVDRHSCVA